MMNKRILSLITALAITAGSFTPVQAAELNNGIVVENQTLSGSESGSDSAEVTVSSDVTVPAAETENDTETIQPSDEENTEIIEEITDTEETGGEQAEETENITGGTVPEETEEDDENSLKAVVSEAAVDENGDFHFEAEVNGYDIVIDAPEGVLPEECEVIVKPINEIDGQNVESVIRDSLEENDLVKNIAAFDITFMQGEDVIQPEDGTVSVQIHLAEKMAEALEADEGGSSVNAIEDAEPELKAFHVDEDTAEATQVEVDVTNGEDVSFEAEEFSPYVITVVEPFEYVGGVQDVPNLEALGNVSVENTGDTNISTVASDVVSGSSLPSKYDNRSKMPNLRDQGNHNSCWAHASMAAAEGSMIAQHGASTSIDYSESHLGYYMYNSVTDPLGNTAGDTTSGSGSYTPSWDIGGNLYYSQIALANWVGAADESDYPYSQFDSTKPNTAAAAYGSDKAHLVNSYSVSTSDIIGMKNLITKLGAVGISYSSDSSFYNYTYNSFYNYRDSYTDHAITIVGWDDSFSKNNFNTKPDTDGAWLCRNSWTTAKPGQYYYNNYKGYFWMSYSDRSLLCDGYGRAYGFEFENADDYDHNYQYDGSFTTGCVYDSKTITAANVFTVKGSACEELDAVSLFSANANNDYEVNIYKNPDPGDPESGTLCSDAATDGSLTYAGYYTITLKNPVLLSKGDTFSVVVTLTNRDGDYAELGCEYKTSSWLSSDVSVDAGTSYVYENGRWQGVVEAEGSNVGNFRIKAFTNDAVDIYQKTSDGITFKVSYPKNISCGADTRFSFSATGGSGDYGYRIEGLYVKEGSEYVPVYDTGSAAYGCEDYYDFKFMASGTYYIQFGVKDAVTQKNVSTGEYGNGIVINISDSEYPSVDEKAAQIVDQCLSEGNPSDYDKTLWLHDYIINNCGCKYDSSSNYCSPEAVFYRSEGNSEAYHRAFALLLNHAGIETGRIDDDTEYVRTWTAAKLNGNWYQFDISYDDAAADDSENYKSHLYFGLDDTTMAMVHLGHNPVKGYESDKLDKSYLIMSGEVDRFSSALVSEIQNYLNNPELYFSIPVTDTPYAALIYSVVAYDLENNDKYNWSIKNIVNVDIECEYEKTGEESGNLNFTVTPDEGMISQDGKIYYAFSDGLYATNKIVRSLKDENGKLYDAYCYFGSDGARVDNSWIKYEDDSSSGRSYWLYAGEDGKLLTGRCGVDDGSFYFATEEYAENNPDTVVCALQKGVISDSGNYYCYYYDDADNNHPYPYNGGYKTGPVRDYKDPETGKIYSLYFNENGLMQQGLTVVGGKTYYFATEADAAEDDTLIPGAMITGIRKIDNNYYYFGDSTSDNTDGQMKYGYFYDAGTGKYYYAEAEDAASNAGVLKSGWIKVNGSWKLFGNGTASFRNNVTTITGSGTVSDSFAEQETTSGDGWIDMTDAATGNYKRYYLNSTGVPVTGWQNIKCSTDGVTYRYYFDTTGEVATGLWKINGKYYYFSEIRTTIGAADDTYGRMQKGRVEVSDGLYMFFDTNGARVCGWQKDNDITHDESYDKWDYYNTADSAEDGGNEAMGAAPDGTDGWYRMTVSGTEYSYYFKNNSSRVTGWQTIDGARYYFDASQGTYLNGAMYTGFINIGSTYYYFYRGTDDSGSKTSKTGQLLTGLTSVKDGSGNHLYYADSNGALKLDWQKINGEWRHFSRTYGYEDGIGDGGTTVISDDYWAEVTDGDGSVNGIYYFRDGKSMVTGLQKIGGKKYYFSADQSNGTYGKLQTGFITVGKNEYYGLTDGELGTIGTLQSGYVSVGSGKYYFNSDCVMLYGWHKVNGQWRYFTTQDDVASDIYGFYNRESGREIEAESSDGCWYEISEGSGSLTRRYYFNDGTRLVTGWQTIGGDKYYFDSNGVCQAGEFYIGKNCYRADSEGRVLQNQWYQSSEGSCIYYRYYNNNGQLMTGWQKLTDEMGNSQNYYLNPDMSDPLYGCRMTGVQVINKSRYILNADGSRAGAGLVTLTYDDTTKVYGITQDMAGTYYCDSNGRVQYGWQQINGEWNYFDRTTGKLLDSSMSNTGFVTVTQADGSTATYYIADGRNMVTGWQTINGQRYYFESDSKKATYGQLYKGWFISSNNKYYADPDSGALAKGVATIGDDEYYFNDKYVMTTGWQLIDSLTGDRRYYSYDSGKRIESEYIGNDFYRVEEPSGSLDHSYYRIVNNSVQKNWQTIDGARYYFDANGKLAVGLFKVGSNWFYTCETGEPAKGRAIDSSTEFATAFSGAKTLTREGTTKTYFFNTNGQRVTGWQFVEKNVTHLDGSTEKVKVKRYFDGKILGTDGILTGQMVTGVIKIYNSYFYFDGEGNLLTNSFVKNNGCTYYANGSGACLTGWQNLAVDSGTNEKTKTSWRYYFDRNGVMQTGMVLISGQRYYLNEEDEAGVRTVSDYPKGAMVSNRSIGSEGYYFNGSGQMLTGWQKINNTWCYYATDVDAAKMGAVLGEKGEYTDYKIGDSCWTDVTLKTSTGDTVIATFYRPNWGTPGKGWQTIKDADNVSRRYYFDQSTGLKYTGLSKIGNNWYLLSSDGYAMSGICTVDGITYGFDSNGKKLFGWQTIKDAGNTSNRYYFDPVDGHMTTGLVTIEKNLYYFDGSGRMAVGLTELSGSSYYFNSDGKAAKGWTTVSVTKDGSTSNKRMYFDTVSYKLRKGNSSDVSGKYILKDSSGKLSLLDGNGYAVANYPTSENGTVDSAKYCTDSSGYLKTGWQSVSLNGTTAKYYFDPVTGLALSGGQIIDGQMYYFYDLDDGNTLTSGKSYPLGAMVSDEVVGDTFTVRDGGVYYLDKNGRALTGWQKVKLSGETEESVQYFTTAQDYTSGRATGIGIHWKVTSLDEGEKTALETSMFPDTLPCWKKITKEYGAGSNLYESNTKETLCYINKNGTVYKGWKTIPCSWSGEMVNKKFYFDENGVLKTGTFSINNQKYHVTESGYAVSGFVYENGEIRYYNANGLMQTGWQTIGLDITGVHEPDADDPEARIDVCSTDTPGRYYFNNNGVMLTGLKLIGNNYYYFESNIEGLGKLKTGTINITDETGAVVKIYCADKNGVIHTDSVPFKQDGNWYYVDPDTFACTDLEKVMPKFGDGYWYRRYDGTDYTYYYLINDRTIAKGFVNINAMQTSAAIPTKVTLQYFFNSNGELAVPDSDGFIYANVDYYLAYSEDQMTGKGFSGVNRAIAKADDAGFITRSTDGDSSALRKGETYYFGADGKLVTGFYTLNLTIYGRSVPRKFYSDNCGRVKTGFFTVGNNTYYGEPKTANYPNPDEYYKGELSFEGKIKSSTGDPSIWPENITLENGKSYDFWFDKNGVIKTGWKSVYITDDYRNRKYYFASATEVNNGTAEIYGAMLKSTYAVIGGKKYYFDNKGMMCDSCYGNNYFGSDGAMRYGWQYTGTEWKYYSPSTGEEVTPTALTYTGTDGYYWKCINGEYYYFINNKTLAKGWQNIKGSFADNPNDGSAATSRFYFDPTTGKLITGKFNVGTKTYYSGTDGKIYMNQWSDDSNSYFGSSGEMLKGLQVISSKVYFFYQNGIKATGVVTVGKDKYLYDADGARLINGSYYYNGAYYYTDKNGKLQTGWIKTGNNGDYTDWSYYDTQTCKKTNITEHASGSTSSDYAIRYAAEENARNDALADPEGYYCWYDSYNDTNNNYRVMVTLGSNGKTYYLTPNGPAKGWAEFFRIWSNCRCTVYTKQYFNSDGCMVTGDFTVNGKKYHAVDFDEYDDSKLPTIGTIITNGWLSDENNNTYFYGKNGEMVTGWYNYTDKTITNYSNLPCARYYFGRDGIMYSGVKRIGSVTYLFRGETENHLFADGIGSGMGQLMTEYTGTVCGDSQKTHGMQYVTDKNGKVIGTR